jgi:hypothetical protein
MTVHRSGGGYFTTVRNSKGMRLYREVEHQSIDLELHQETKKNLRSKKREAEREASKIVKEKIFTIIRFLSIPPSKRDDLLDKVSRIIDSNRGAFGKITAIETELGNAGIDLQSKEVKSAFQELKQVVSEMTNPNQFYKIDR